MRVVAGLARATIAGRAESRARRAVQHFWRLFSSFEFADRDDARDEPPGERGSARLGFETTRWDGWVETHLWVSRTCGLRASKCARAGGRSSGCIALDELMAGDGDGRRLSTRPSPRINIDWDAHRRAR